MQCNAMISAILLSRAKQIVKLKCGDKNLPGILSKLSCEQKSVKEEVPIIREQIPPLPQSKVPLPTSYFRPTRNY